MCVCPLLLWVWVWSRGKEFQGLGKKTPVVRMCVCVCTCDCKADLFVMTRGLNRGQHPSASLNTARKLLLPDTRARQTTNYCTCHSIPSSLLHSSHHLLPPFCPTSPQTCKQKHTRNQWQHIHNSRNCFLQIPAVTFMAVLFLFLLPSIPIGTHTPTDRPTDHLNENMSVIKMEEIESVSGNRWLYKTKKSLQPSAASLTIGLKEK